MFINQDYDTRYTDEDHRVWATLCARRMEALPHTGSHAFLEGLKLLDLDLERVPRLEAINARLAPLTGFQAVAVHGYLPAREFFECLAQRQFPTTVTLRSMDRLDYIPEPDIFHDVFGHVPLHTDPYLADFLQRFGQAGLAAESEEELTGLSRLFWFTVEFGLIREAGQVRLFGSGLMSSVGESAHALSDAVERRDFDLHAVWNQPFEIDHYQPLLFVIDSFEQLFHVMDDRARELERRPVLA
jgi:phenylalanine-4-hydroxylase